MIYFYFFALFLVCTTTKPPKRALWSVENLVSGVLRSYKAADKYKVSKRTIKNQSQEWQFEKILSRITRSISDYGWMILMLFNTLIVVKKVIYKHVANIACEITAFIRLLISSIEFSVYFDYIVRQSQSAF